MPKSKPILLQCEVCSVGCYVNNTQNVGYSTKLLPAEWAWRALSISQRFRLLGNGRTMYVEDKSASWNDKLNLEV